MHDLQFDAQELGRQLQCSKANSKASTEQGRIGMSDLDSEAMLATALTGKHAMSKCKNLSNTDENSVL